MEGGAVEGGADEGGQRVAAASSRADIRARRERFPLWRRLYVSGYRGRLASGPPPIPGGVMNISAWLPSLVPARSIKRLVPLLLLLLLLGAALGCSLFDTGSGEERELQRVGVPAQAEILSIGETGLTVNDDPVITVGVEVRPADRAPYQATIKRILISRLEVPQFQPGKIIPVRFDPRDPSQVAFDIGPPKSARTGNPFADNFTAQPQGAATALLPPPPAPAVYRGGADDSADTRALIESGYLPMGVSEFQGGAADPRQAAAQGKRIGAALVVVYGGDLAAMAAVAGVAGAPGGAGLAPLPFHPAPPAGAASADAAGGGGTIGSLPQLSKSDHRATYWGKGEPPILGVDGRPLDDQEKGRLMLKAGVLVVVVAANSPASAAHMQPGDVMVAIDGKKILDPTAVPAFIKGVAGRKVRIDVLRNGAPLSLYVQLNPAPP
jgi:hypothetical protein